MSVIYVLLTISIMVALLFFIAFIHSVRSGQYEDSYTPSVRMLFEDELLKSDETKERKTPEIQKTNSKSKQM
ncbi:cytochrome oxidase maturation protein, cbb3-type [Muriicola jejuensis]|uniref:Cbb3-type cytochrome oxidase assembly protein CcoS n=1 Tax=Muriicola jejuensis TaxID=504488 RepID=A0A6P0UAQ6_9FLAO|nr:cbb3-type cytochrome oxidase assembly protein CcoS [Muriicola jejuensis]NER09590.1 cbb3-type cytochrome oxidase assembly protein CcoS [Muriicola jejuensis]SMP07523.1 cytochrome oxidase maturation protein, cbb3-type [Muriicola jejuensis]